MDHASTTFAALSDPIRLRLLALMAREGELCVCEMTQALDIPQPKASKHLATLREVGLVRMRRDAQWVLYSIADDAPDWVRRVIRATVEGLENDPVPTADRERLAAMADRPSRCRA